MTKREGRDVEWNTHSYMTTSPSNFYSFRESYSTENFLYSLKLFYNFNQYDFLQQMGDLTQTTEMMLFIEEVYLSLLRHPVFWKSQLTQLTLQLLCICEVSLKITGECSSLIQLLECSIELLGEVRPT